MDINDRLYWFVRNMFAFILLLIFVPFLWCWQLLGATMTLTVTDGSEVIAWPWQWKWM